MAAKKEPTIRRLSESGPLQELLLQICPPNRKGVKSITVLADRMKLSSQTIYNWIKNNRIPPKQVKGLIKLARGRVTLEQIIHYVVR